MLLVGSSKAKADLGIPTSLWLSAAMLEFTLVDERDLMRPRDSTGKLKTCTSGVIPIQIPGWV